MTEVKIAMYFILAMAVSGAIFYVDHLQNENDRLAADIAQKDQRIELLKGEVSARERMIYAARESETMRLREAERIEAERNDRAKRNTAILAKPENKKVADIELPSDMLDGLRQ